MCLMIKQKTVSDAGVYKIEIEGPPEELQRISTFLDNNFIKYNVKDANCAELHLKEIDGYFDWPLE